jgi:hypothetical protein
MKKNPVIAISGSGSVVGWFYERPAAMTVSVVKRSTTRGKQ